MIDEIGMILIILTLITAVVLGISLYINIRKSAKAEQAAREARVHLQESYENLEIAYEEVTAAQKKLNKKYDKLKEKEEMSRKLAHIDSLTQLPNRAAFTEKLDAVLDETLGKDSQIAVMCIDINNLKEINDDLGHSYGDELLLDVSYRILQAMDTTDYLARYGGDEFMLLFPEVPEIEEFENNVKKLQKIFQYPFVLSQKEYFLTVSMGICFAPKDGKNAQVILKNVDTAMYAAKDLHNSSYCYFEEALNERRMADMEWQSELRSAIDKKEFEVCYQPQLEVSTNRLVGFEATIRWNHKEKGIIPLREFIDLAEKTGLIVPIGSFLLTKACDQLKEWKEAGHLNLHLSVNLSARQFKDIGLLPLINGVLEKTEIDPSQLEFGITEMVVLEDIAYSKKIFDRWSQMGIQITIDQFGAGNLATNYLPDLPISNLRIGKDLTADVLENEKERNRIRVITSLKEIYGLHLCADGVRNKDQLIYLQNAGCERMQGAFYYEALSREEADTLLSL